MYPVAGAEHDEEDNGCIDKGWSQIKVEEPFLCVKQTRQDDAGPVKKEQEHEQPLDAYAQQLFLGGQAVAEGRKNNGAEDKPHKGQDAEKSRSAVKKGQRMVVSALRG